MHATPLCCHLYCVPHAYQRGGSTALSIARCCALCAQGGSVHEQGSYAQLSEAGGELFESPAQSNVTADRAGDFPIGFGHEQLGGGFRMP